MHPRRSIIVLMLLIFGIMAAAPPHPAAIYSHPAEQG